MLLPRGPRSLRFLRPQPWRTARAGQTWHQIGRRSYASEQAGGTKKAGSDLPWLITSVAITVPACAYLWQKGPKREKPGDHHHHEKHEGNEGSEDGSSTDGETTEPNLEHSEDSKQVGSKEEGEDREAKGEMPIGEAVRNEPPNEITASENKFTSGDEGLKEGPDDTLHMKSQQTKTVDPEADEGARDGPRDDIDQGHEGEQKGTRVTKGDKKRTSEDPRTNAMHPYMADERKSKKGEGVIETAKLTGTVDINRKPR